MKLKLYDNFKHWLDFDVIWVISDTHFEDSDCKLMDPNWVSPEEQVKLINSKVGKKSLLIILGDVGNKEWVKKLKGYKVLICGNHDEGYTTFKRVVREEEVPLEVTRDQMSEDFSHFRISKEFEQVGEIPYEKYRLGEFKYAIFDNKLFDEVYEGPVFISNKILLSHEPINIPFGVNIHGHDHSGKSHGNSINLAANVIGYEPKRLDKLIESIDLVDIHRITIDKATQRKAKN